MKRLLLLLLLVLINILLLNAQNLCPNGDFETYSTPPSTYAQICLSTGWSNPSGSCSLIAGTGSPDFYSTLGTGGAKAPGTFLATISPHGGNDFAGFATYYSSANYREYIRTTLANSLIPGNTYAITCWISNGTSSLHYYGTNNIGFNFSALPMTQTLGAPILTTPQVETSTVLYSTGWQQISFLYTPTVSAQYLTIGNFHNDATTTRTLFGPNLSSSFGAYYYIDDISITLISPLPVELLSFEGKNVNHKNELNWSTATEINNDRFEIEKSTDGILFYMIGQVSGNGTKSCRSDYQFCDEKPGPGITYYRLRQVDYDGNFNYSEKIAVENTYDDFEVISFSISENSFEGELILNNKGRESLNILICTSNGQIVSDCQIFPDNGFQIIPVPLKNVSSGIYLLKISDGQKIVTRKIVCG